MIFECTKKKSTTLEEMQTTMRNAVFGQESPSSANDGTKM
jgi:hypothetical protein